MGKPSSSGLSSNLELFVGLWRQKLWFGPYFPLSNKRSFSISSFLFWRVPPFKEILDKEDICLEKSKYNEEFSGEREIWYGAWVSDCLIILAPWSLILRNY